MSYEERVKKLLSLKDDDVVKMRAFYGKNEDEVKQDILIIREWLRQQAHLPQDEGNGRLERFLVSNKFRLEDTKTKLENCYTFRSMYPEIMNYYDVHGEVYKEAIKSFQMVPLPKMTNKMERIIYIKKLNNLNFDHNHFFHACMVFEMLQTYDSSLKFVFIVDNNYITFEDVKKADFTFAQKSTHFVINAISVTFSHVININTPTFYDILLKLFKMLMKPKLFDRFSIHSKIESVYKILPKELLPIELGGQNGSIEKLHSEWLSVINDNPEVFKEIANRKSIEELRIGEIKANELFGVKGSFRKLNLD